MMKLLRAGFRRYFKNIFTWITFAIIFLIGCLGAAEVGPHSSPDDIYLLSLVIGIPAMITLCIGMEVGSGAVRNKIVKGYRKGQIFLCELIMALTIVFVMFVITGASFILPNLPILKTIPFEVLCKIVIGMIMMNLGVAVIAVAISCLIHNRAISAVLSLVLILGILFMGYYLNDQLNNPEFFVAYNSEGTMIENSLRNPNYVDGAQRTIYEFLYNANPMGQMIEYSEVLSPYFTPHYVKLETPQEEMDFINSAPLYSLGIILIVSSAGYILFRKKNVK